MSALVEATQPSTLWQVAADPAQPDAEVDAVQEMKELLGDTKSFFALLMQYALMIMRHGQDCTRNAIKRHTMAVELRQQGEKILRKIDGLQTVLSKETDATKLGKLDKEIMDFLADNDILDFRKKRSDGQESAELNLTDMQKLGVEVSAKCSGMGNYETEMSIAVNEANMNNEAGTKLAKSFLEMLKNLIFEIIQALR